MSYGCCSSLDLVIRIPLLAFLVTGFYGVGTEMSSYTWRLDANAGKVMPATYIRQSPLNEDNSEEAYRDPNVLHEAVLDILTTTVVNSDGTWKKTSREIPLCARGEANCSGGMAIIRNNRGVSINKMGQKAVYEDDDSMSDEDDDDWRSESLECSKPVNFTYYDHLVGIQNRATHPDMPEPDVIELFKATFASKKKGGDLSLDVIERRLKKSKREKAKSIELYNHMGNYWRIKGQTQKAIECFRRALAVAPNNAEILLNLARILFNLQYLDDAIFLTRRSLEVQPPDQNAWQQHFQLGEILKAYCHYQEAALHLRHVLELKPNYGPAIEALKDMESLPDSSVHLYTIIIIILLVVGVLLWIALSIDFHRVKEKSSQNGSLSNGHAHSDLKANGGSKSMNQGGKPRKKNKISG